MPDFCVIYARVPLGINDVSMLFVVWVVTICISLVDRSFFLINSANHFYYYLRGCPVTKTNISLYPSMIAQSLAVFV